jgi:hypothetical protein
MRNAGVRRVQQLWDLIAPCRNNQVLFGWCIQKLIAPCKQVTQEAMKVRPEADVVHTRLAVTVRHHH